MAKKFNNDQRWHSPFIADFKQRFNKATYIEVRPAQVILRTNTEMAVYDLNQRTHEATLSVSDVAGLHPSPSPVQRGVLPTRIAVKFLLGRIYNDPYLALFIEPRCLEMWVIRPDAVIDEGVVDVSWSSGFVNTKRPTVSQEKAHAQIRALMGDH